MTDITELIEETENTEFLIGSGPDPEDNATESLQEVETFLQESKRRLHVIEEEKRRSIFFDVPAVCSDDSVTVNGDTGVEELKVLQDGENDEEQEAAFKTLQQSLMDLTNLGQVPLPEGHGGCRPRTSSIARLRTSSIARPPRPKSSFPVLEGRMNEWTSIVQKIPSGENHLRRKIDINTLDMELAKLLSMSESLVSPSVSEGKEPSSPYPVPAAPPSTPATSMGNHPLSPTELFNRVQMVQTENAAPPPKPPRLFLPPTEETETFENQIGRVRGNSLSGVPPKKPPRVSTNLSIDKLKQHIAKLSKSTGNLSVLDESSKDDKPAGPLSAEDFKGDSCDVNKTSGGKVENFFSKLASKRKTKRSHSLVSHRVVIGDPSDFRHVAGKTKILKERETLERSTSNPESESHRGEDNTSSTLAAHVTSAPETTTTTTALQRQAVVSEVEILISEGTIPTLTEQDLNSEEETSSSKESIPPIREETFTSDEKDIESEEKTSKSMTKTETSEENTITSVEDTSLPAAQTSVLKGEASTSEAQMPSISTDNKGDISKEVNTDTYDEVPKAVSTEPEET